jgi:2-oxoglutarate ferredoxin oxidoreductase subunit beta
MNCVLEAVGMTGWDQNKTVFLSGLGCSSRAPGYIYADSLHTTHGRAIAFAMGSNGDPSLHVVVFTGDGISQPLREHFIHACRRILTYRCLHE